MTMQNDFMTESHSEALRLRLAAFMAEQGVKATPWAKAAGIQEGTLRGFLNGKTTTMTFENVARLAAAAKVTLAILTGEEPTIVPIGTQSGVDVIHPLDNNAPIVESPPFTTIRLRGYLTGRGDVVEFNPNLDEPDFQLVKTASPIPAEWQAFKIVDADMWPFEDGWIIFFASAEIEDCNGKLCLVELSSGERLFKRVFIVNGRCDLHALTPSVAPVHNVDIQSVLVFRQLNSPEQAESEPDAD